MYLIQISQEPELWNTDLDRSGASRRTEWWDVRPVWRMELSVCTQSFF
jgi:hypothetical protein